MLTQFLFCPEPDQKKKNLTDVVTSQLKCGEIMITELICLITSSKILFRKNKKKILTQLRKLNRLKIRKS